MHPTNVFLLPIPANNKQAGKAICDLCARVQGHFLPDRLTTPGGHNRWRLWVRAEQVAA